jgi:hypothetical protein
MGEMRISTSRITRLEGEEAIRYAIDHRATLYRRDSRGYARQAAMAEAMGHVAARRAEEVERLFCWVLQP